VTYPHWSYFPRNERPPQWVTELVGVVEAHRVDLDTQPMPEAESERLTSDRVLGVLRPGMVALGYTVESGKLAGQRIERPVLFGDNGHESVRYEIDAFHDDLGIAVEVEAGRGAMGNADYRDIIRMSLLLDARFMVLMMPLVYRYKSGSKTQQTSAFDRTRDQLTAIFASQRLRLPFEGSLLVGY